MSEGADAPLDEVDDAVLAELAAAYELADPPPADLDERVTFAIALRQVAAEVAALSADELVGSGARGRTAPRTVTFDSTSLTIMITVVEQPDGLRRVDGWLAPAGAMRVELRSGGSAEPTHAVTADETGRFVIDGVAAGLAQVIVHRDEPGGAIVTPAVVL